jgi:hypothetical protein
MTELQRARIASDNARGAVRAMARNVENLARLLAIRTAEVNDLRQALEKLQNETAKGEGHE